MFVILVAALLTGLGIGRLSGFLKQKSLQGDIQSQLVFVQLCRSIAIKKNIQAGILFDAAKSPPSAGPSGGTIPVSGLSGSWTACLIRSTASQQVQAFIWDGGSWRLL